MNEYTNNTKKSYWSPTPEEAKCRERVYANVQYMRELKNKTMPHFQSGPEGARSFNTYLDDSERILNGYTPSRQDQGKEDYRSNLMDNITLAKVKEHVKKTKQKIGGFYDLAAEEKLLRDSQK